MLGISPFDFGRPMDFGRPIQARRPQPMTRPAASPRAAPKPMLRLYESQDGYEAALDVPAGSTLHSVDLSLTGDNELIIKGCARARGVLYFAHRPTPVFTTPLATRVVGEVPAGATVHGSVPDSGWVELDEGEGWIPDRYLEVVRSVSLQPRPFTCSLKLPCDVDLNSLVRNGQGSDTTVRMLKKPPRVVQTARPMEASDEEPTVADYVVVYAPRVSVRTRPRVDAPVAAFAHAGDVVRGAEVVPDWIMLAPDKWIMRRHPRFGTLLRRLDEHSAPHAPDPPHTSLSPQAVDVHTARDATAASRPTAQSTPMCSRSPFVLKQPESSASASPSQPQSSSRPRSSSSTASSMSLDGSESVAPPAQQSRPKAHKPSKPASPPAEPFAATPATARSRPTPAPATPANPAATPPAPPSTASVRHSAAPAGQAPKSGLKRKPARPVDVLPPTTQLPVSEPVLTERAASDDNVQRPDEAVEEWRATAEGGFARDISGCTRAASA